MSRMETTGKFIKRKAIDIGSHLYRNILFPFVKIAIERGKDSIIEKGAYFNKGTKIFGKDYIGNRTQMANTSIGYSTYIGPDSNINNAQIGSYCCIAGLETATGRHPVKGENISIHPAFYSKTAQYGYTYVKDTTFEETEFADKDRGYNVVIGSDVWIGRGVMITDGVTIGDGAVIGARSLVTADVEPYAIYAGTPAKKIGDRFDEETKCKLLKIKWWEKDEAWIREHAGLFSDPERFINSMENE